jgi:hypothetical protein
VSQEVLAIDICSLLLGCLVDPVDTLDTLETLAFSLPLDTLPLAPLEEDSLDKLPTLTLELDSLPLELEELELEELDSQ